jgi:transcriptional regulator with XRE-family HTH domain
MRAMGFTLFLGLIYNVLLNYLMDAIIYTMCINVNAAPSQASFTFLDCSPVQGNLAMGKRMAVAHSVVSTNRAQTDEGFNSRLATFRKAAGFTQAELASELAISQRMVAYYESPEATPPAHLLPDIARVLGVSIDTLYGRDAPKRKLAKQEGDSRLRRRLLAVEKLGTAEKRQVLQLIDAFIERGQLRSKVQRQT